MSEYKVYEVPRGQSPLIFKSRQSGEIIVFHTLPLASRSVEEILEDRAIEFAAAASRNRSTVRREPK
ncbi:MAG: hypothetical protein JWO96_478 [Candidatus Saccharibacteria bacterium]|nr:hypothetical protein [Candidatus Saccharibacteria bacterium]